MKTMNKSVLVHFFCVAMINIMTKSNLGKKGVILTYGHNPLPREARAGSQGKQ